MGKVSGLSVTTRITPTIDTSAYGDGDQLGGEMVIDIGTGGTGAASIFDAFVIQSISVIDIDAQSAAIDLVFFDDSVTIASDNAAADFTDAQLKANFLGAVSIAATDYKAFNDNVAATVRNVGLQLHPTTGGDDHKIYVYAVSRGTPTYATTSSLTFKFDLACDL